MSLDTVLALHTALLEKNMDKLMEILPVISTSAEPNTGGSSGNERAAAVLSAPIELTPELAATGLSNFGVDSSG